MEQNLALWGTGFYGRHTYRRLKDSYNIVCFIDNNPAMQGTMLFDIPVVSPTDLPKLYKEGVKVVTCVKKYDEVSLQIISMGILDYYVMLEGFIFHNSPDETMQPVEIGEYPCHKKSSEEKNVLFVQNTACIRTNKLATCVKNCGYKIYLLYTLSSSLEEGFPYADLYDDTFNFSSAQGLIDFVSASEFDIIHSSNEPDFLTTLLQLTGKTVIHDCHDLGSLCKNMTTDELLLEYRANVLSDGVIYTTEGARQAAEQIFGLRPGKTLVLGNYISENLAPIKQKNKLSELDSSLHAVYEGALSNNPNDYKCFNDIWAKIAQGGIHIHFYTNANEGYCRSLEKLNPNYIHYEGNLTSQELANEMSQYDVGLAIYNMTKPQKKYLEYSSPNKIHEYINAGIPVAVGDVEYHRKFLADNGYGGQVIITDSPDKIREQLARIAKIRIPPKILQQRGQTMESQIPSLIEFYEHCKKGKVA